MAEVAKSSGLKRKAPENTDENAEGTKKAIVELEPIDFAYTEENFQEWTTKNGFFVAMGPKIVKKYPDASSEDVSNLLSRMWVTYSGINPFISNEGLSEAGIDEREEAESENGEDRPSQTRKGGLKVRLAMHRQKNVDATGSSKRKQKLPPRYQESSEEEEEAEASDSRRRTRPSRAAAKASRSKVRTTKDFPERELEMKDGDEDEDGYETDHQDYCEECQQGGEILLCDTCPRAYHLVCADLDAVPLGLWCCPHCEVVGVTPATAKDKAKKKPKKNDDEDEGVASPSNNAYCSLCKKSGTSAGDSVSKLSEDDLLPCTSCTSSFHMGCLRPSQRPGGSDSTPGDDLSEWECPRCLCDPLPDRVATILTWDWDEEQGDKAEDKAKKPPRHVTRKFFVRFRDRSYWECTWVTETQLEVHQPATLRAYFKRVNKDVPPPPEDGILFRGNHTKRGADPLNLQERFYQWGVRPEYLQAQRVISRRTQGGAIWYLVKWRDLEYEQCTWERTDKIKGLDLQPVIETFEKRCQSFSSREEKKKKDVRSQRKQLQTHYPKQPAFMAKCGGELHPYQLEGLNWLRHCYANHVNTILADEMGLGKTIQTIAFLQSLVAEGHSKGPFLISAPLSTIINWEREFEFWAPELIVVVYSGNKDSRGVIRNNEMTPPSKGGNPKNKSGFFFHVVLTSYELVSVDRPCLNSLEWEVLVVDEAHRLKNNQSKFFRVLSQYRIAYKLLLTGTPLQNNLEELFNLLNFMQREKFSDMQGFLDEFEDISREEQVKKLHEMLGKHLLRRLKADVFKTMPAKEELIVRVDLSPMQKKFYKHILTRNYQALAGSINKNSVSLLNILMDLRKCCNHPFLFPSAAEECPLLPNGAFEGSPLEKACGKLILLSKMLDKLRERGHRVLIFSQMTRLLDLLEDFLDYKEIHYERIDGSVMGQLRQDAIDRFNAPDSNSFVFLLSTKAGGLGINLATADTVIIYDSDWNPHNDIQALSRAHRIGQSKKVMIYRFVTRNSVEEKVMQAAKKKMMLTHLVVRGGMGGKTGGLNFSKKDLDDILKFGAETLFKEDNEGDPNATSTDTNKIVYDDAALEKLLDRTHKGVVNEEGQVGLNDFFTSFKVAKYEVRKDDQEEAEEEEKEEEVPEETENLETRDPNYWQKLLGLSHQVQEEQEMAQLGKGRRTRRPVNYTLHAGPVVATASDQEDFELSDVDSENDDSDTGRRTRKTDLDRMPPLLVNAGGFQEVLGFNPRQRKVFLNSVMRYGLPIWSSRQTQWLTRELIGKSERALRAYVTLFMRHLCDTQKRNPEGKFTDGVPIEGLSKENVLSRIGILALIRKKVVDYEKKNPEWSLLVAVSEPGDVQATNVTTPAYEFEIAEGGLTELHALWRREDDLLPTKPSPLETWHARHDYWLLAGVVAHGYGRWAEIAGNKRFGVINIPFPSDMGDMTEAKHRFLARRFKLLEQALLVEEQLRRLTYMYMLEAAPDSEVEEDERARRTEVLSQMLLKMGPKKIFEAYPGSKVEAVLKQTEELLVDLKHDSAYLPASISIILPGSFTRPGTSVIGATGPPISAD